MKIKTSELIGRQLNYAVEHVVIADMRAAGDHIKEWWVAQKQASPSPYSTDWALGGPIIEREGIGLFFDRACGNRWRSNHTTAPSFLDKSPLIAAMRCYVASKLGDEVEIPDELI